MKLFSRLIAALTASLLVLSACQTAPPPPQAPPDNSAAAQAQVRAADAEWAKAAESKQLDAMVAYYSDDAIVLPPNEPVAKGKDAVKAALGPMFSAPGFSLTWKATDAGAAKSGEMGYTVGTYDMTMNDAKGNPMPDHGKYVTIWKKQADGSWKAAVDAFNSDAPAAPPSMPAKK